MCFESTIKVLHVVNGEHYSGAERVQDLLALRLPEYGFPVGLACLKPDRFPELRMCRETPLFETPMRSRFDVAAVYRLRDIVRQQDFQLLHAHTPRSVLLASIVARLTGKPLVYHVHSPVGRDSTRPLRNWLNERVERWSLRRAARLITVSRSLADYMEHRGYAREILRVVPNGVPPSRQLRTDQPPTQEWTLGTVALFRPRKGTEVLLQALAELKKQGRAVRLRAVGTFETAGYQEQLDALVRRLGLQNFVQWTGFRSDVAAELVRMDLFVLPSLFGEGLPMVVLESMAAGVPVVATRVEGVPEAIRDGIDGVLAAPANAQDLAAAIGRVMDGKLCWKTLQEHASARHARSFSDHAMAAGVSCVYREILGRAADTQ